MRTLVVWCPDWPVVAAGQPGAPLAVLHANRVVASSQEARLDGVVRGLRRREAQARCPELVVVDADPSVEARAFEPIVARLEKRFTPRVEIVRPGLCAFATRGPSRYFGGDDVLAGMVAGVVDEALHVVLGQPDVCCRVGVADGPFAAQLAARRGVVVPPGESPGFLAPFPVRVLERPELVDLLVRLGIRTLGDLAALPAEAVLGRFGSDGAAAHRLARGLDERPLDLRTPPPDLVAALEMDPPAERVDAAAFAGRTLAADLHQRLADLGLACSRIAIEAETEHGERFVRLWRHDGALTAGAIAERVRWQLDGWLREGADAPTSGITLLRLVPDEVHPDDGRQMGFWGGSTAADDRAARALARVQGLLGPDAVVTAVVAGGRGPAEQAHLVRWGDPRDPGARDPSRPWPGRLPAPSPSVVHPVALPAAVVGPSGEDVVVTGRGLLNVEPAKVSVDGGAWTAVDGWAGPWLVDERWWDPPAHRRRARFQVRPSSGPPLLLAVEGGRWWVEATYE